MDALGKFTARRSHAGGTDERVPDDAPPRLPHGYYDFAAATEGDFERPTLSDLRQLISAGATTPVAAIPDAEPRAIHPDRGGGTVEVWAAPTTTAIRLPSPP